MKVLVIPDVHLKLWIFDEADKLIDKYNLDNAIFIGDLVDDWNKQNCIDLYKETIDRAELFKCMHKDSFFCYGNHEVAYIVNGACSGNSNLFRSEIKYLLNKYERIVEPKIVHKIDNVIFSHAGIHDLVDVDNRVQQENDKSIVKAYNDMNSPLWLRPKYLYVYDENYMQVAGHTPVKNIYCENNIWYVDTFSTYPDGSQYGNQTFMSIDTISFDVTIYYNNNIVKEIINRKHRR